MLDDEIEALASSMAMLHLASDKYQLAADALEGRRLTSRQGGLLLDVLQNEILQMRFASKVLQGRLLDLDESLFSPRVSAAQRRCIATAVGMARRPDVLCAPPAEQRPGDLRRGVDVCTPRDEPSSLSIDFGWSTSSDSPAAMADGLNHRSSTPPEAAFSSSQVGPVFAVPRRAFTAPGNSAVGSWSSFTLPRLPLSAPGSPEPRRGACSLNEQQRRGEAWGETKHESSSTTMLPLSSSDRLDAHCFERSLSLQLERLAIGIDSINDVFVAQANDSLGPSEGVGREYETVRTTDRIETAVFDAVLRESSVMPCTTGQSTTP
eukprot:CAMPEP_0117534760 /NCGR_PEP_ID=MMETSP0784-20121206/40579_1 /TAXON_ID=39447 /ORGANISM="" /LENGTH=320 /DNA_ID=CAMNT_0005331253 /DNA_START=86 /DNA_END=1048 /DNA_ORIENTATION=-